MNYVAAYVTIKLMHVDAPDEMASAQWLYLNKKK